MKDANLYNSRQHGFQSGRSCLSQLLQHHQAILEALQNHDAVDVVYLDFAKAFDKVDFNILLRKLKAIGICGKVLRWISDFLVGRKQMVKVSGQLSTEGPVHSGVPQGSSLGPLLFLIMISDIDSSIEHVTVSSFADDTRLLKTVEAQVDCGKMQDDLIGIYGWAEANHMKFNSGKFEVLNYSARNRNLYKINEVDWLYDYPSYYDPNNKLIAAVEKVRDLGVKLSNDAKFHLHISESVCNASRYAGWILRTFNTREPYAMLTLFKTMVLPRIEYCCPLWSPITIGLIRQLEAVQRSFTAKIHQMGDLDYWGRLKKLGLYSLERRRERYQIIYIYKILQGLVPNFEGERYQIKLEYNDRRGRTCRVPGINVLALSSITSMIEASLSVRGPNLFNRLPIFLRNFNGSVNAFKHKLDIFLKCIPDRPSLPGYQQSAPSNSIIDQLATLRAAGIFLN